MYKNLKFPLCIEPLKVKLSRLKVELMPTSVEDVGGSPAEFSLLTSERPRSERQWPTLESVYASGVSELTWVIYHCV
jgi:hypothetical protein